VQFKNKIKSNVYEFIITIEPESDSDSLKSNSGFFKQYKVKRSLAEFQELFDYLESKNPSDLILREYDYNQMFNSE
jgi:hypothetical protein